MAKGEISCPECGGIFDPRAGAQVHPRSPKHHKAFFYMIRLAAANWPEQHEFQPEGINPKGRQEHLRAWLLCKAGWRRMVGQPLEPNAGDIETDRFWATLLHAAQAQQVIVFRVTDEHGKKFGVAAKSISEGECDPIDFRSVFDEVLFIIEETLGIKVEFVPSHLRELKDVWGHTPGKTLVGALK